MPKKSEPGTRRGGGDAFRAHVFLDSKSGGQKICYPVCRTLHRAIWFPRFIAPYEFLLYSVLSVLAKTGVSSVATARQLDKRPSAVAIFWPDGGGRQCILAHRSLWRRDAVGFRRLRNGICHGLWDRGARRQRPRRWPRLPFPAGIWHSKSSRGALKAEASVKDVRADHGNRLLGCRPPRPHRQGVVKSGQPDRRIYAP